MTPFEISLMPLAVISIATELGIRFLADYLRGDTYFQLGPADPPDLNRVRGLAQLRLADELRGHWPEAERIVFAATPEHLHQLDDPTVPIRKLLRELLPLLTAQDGKNVNDFLFHNEWGLAWNELWANLSVMGCTIETAQFQRLKEAGAAFGGEVLALEREFPILHR